MKNEKNIVNNKTNMWVAIVLALAIFSVCVVSGFVAMVFVNKKDKNTIENLYNGYAYSLYDSLNNLEMGLSKLMISPDNAQNLMILLDCYRQAEIAESALTSLPIIMDSEGTNKIINQIGDYVKGYAAAIARHKPCEKFEESAQKFYNCSESLKSGAAELLNSLGSGKKITQMGMAIIKADKIDEKSRTHHSVEYPELIYDGPFSDGKQAKHFKLLENKSEISESDAIKIIRENISGLENSEIVCNGKSVSDEPCYQFSAKMPSGEGCFSVTARGGLIVAYSVNREFKKGKLSEDAVKSIAEDAAKKLGYNAQSVWYNASGNVATVNLAPIIDEIIFYPDLVKVKVALDDGSVVGVEASGYCLNSCARKLSPTMSAKAAESMVSKKLKIITTRLAVIPLGEKEVLSYEVCGEYDGLQYFVYIDAFNGEELKILRVIDSYQGKQTI